LKIHEYQAKTLFRKHGVPVPQGEVAFSPTEARDIARKLGGRVVVMGYYPWSQMHHLAKSSQMKAVCAWLSRERLPVVLETFSRVHVWARQPTPERLACVLLNASLDPARRPSLRFASEFRKVTWNGMDGRSRTLKPAAIPEAGACRVETPTLSPWSVSLVVAAT